MADITPFRGLRYNKVKLGDTGKLLAPPYDVISPERQDALYARNGHNVVRLDFGRIESGDNEKENRYTRSAAYLKTWLKEGVLVREHAPAIYFYEVDYKTPSGEAKMMSGIICMLRLEDWENGVVLPHEGTLKGPKADRFELLKATNVSASQIFSIYSDPKGSITTAMRSATDGVKPDIEAIDDDGAAHRVWAVKDEDAIETAMMTMKGRKVFIADGHHRYETALAYRDYRRHKGQSGGSEYVPMFLSNMDEDGLTILPTHRLIKDAGGLGVQDVLKRSSRYFDIEELRPGSGEGRFTAKDFLLRLAERGASTHAFGFCMKGSDSYYLLTLKELNAITEALRCLGSEALCNLDVTVLHALVIERVLGIDTKAISESQPVQFEKDGEKAIERVFSGEFAMCFLLNATKVKEVKEVALAREIMPQKSTYFYPKLLTGLVIAEL